MQKADFINSLSQLDFDTGGTTEPLRLKLQNRTYQQFKHLISA